MGLETLFSLQATDSEWVNTAARTVLKVLGPATADWWAADWQLLPGQGPILTLAAASAVGVKMASEFPATTHTDLPLRMARNGGFTTVTGAGLWTEHACDFFADMRRQDAVAVSVSHGRQGFVVGRLLQSRALHPPGDRRRLAPVVRSLNLAWRVRKHLALGHRHELADAIFQALLTSSWVAEEQDGGDLTDGEGQRTRTTSESG